MSEANISALECQHLAKIFQTRTGPVPALEDISFQVKEQEFVCIVGPSGCGKTTLLKLIAGLLAPTSGRISLSSDRNRNWPGLAMIFQEPGLFPWLTVLDNAAFGLEMQGINKLERQEQAQLFIKKIGLADFSRRYPHELSGGMRQRVAIARAFLANPHMLLMDEPFGALDAQTRLLMQEELLQIWREYKKVVIYVTHDIEEAILLGDRVLVMSARPGHICQEIPIPLTRPRHLLTQTYPEAMEMKWHIWKILKEEVLRSLPRPS